MTPVPPALLPAKRKALAFSRPRGTKSRMTWTTISAPMKENMSFGDLKALVPLQLSLVQ